MLSMILGAYNMTREVPRTLHTLSRQYQTGIDPLDYEVVVIENGSTDRLSEEMVTSYGPQFRHIWFDEGCASPVRSVNHAVSQCSGDIICIMNDGARMLSPGIIENAMAVFRAYPNAVVSTLSWHLGSQQQMVSIQQGYCQAVEDKLLETVPWRQSGYALFTISVLAGSSQRGWFQPPAESNCLFMSRKVFEQVGGLDERFISPGGGLIALDFFKTIWLQENVQPVMLLGEGTFHQVHGGVATNAPAAERDLRMKRMHDEYNSIRGCVYEAPVREAIYFGKLPPEAHSVMKLSAENL